MLGAWQYRGSVLMRAHSACDTRYFSKTQNEYAPLIDMLHGAHAGGLPLDKKQQ